VLVYTSGEKQDVFYFERPGEKDILADVCLAT
jgi:hypothetical protein